MRTCSRKNAASLERVDIPDGFSERGRFHCRSLRMDRLRPDKIWRVQDH
jgi:hypothetical protein